MSFPCWSKTGNRLCVTSISAYHEDVAIVLSPCPLVEKTVTTVHMRQQPRKHRWNWLTTTRAPLTTLVTHVDFYIFIAFVSEVNSKPVLLLPQEDSVPCKLFLLNPPVRGPQIWCKIGSLVTVTLDCTKPNSWTSPAEDAVYDDDVCNKCITVW